MARPPRLRLPSYPHHVIQRANHRQQSRPSVDKEKRGSVRSGLAAPLELHSDPKIEALL